MNIHVHVPFETKYFNNIEQQFFKFHRDNPRVYEMFDRFTRELILAGRTHFSADAVLHRIRFYTAVETTEVEYKINNNYSAYYARLWMDNNPQHDGFFRLRSVRD